MLVPWQTIKNLGSVEANGVNLKVVWAKFLTFNVMSVIITQARPHLQLKARPRFRPVSLSWSTKMERCTVVEKNSSKCWDHHRHRERENGKKSCDFLQGNPLKWERCSLKWIFWMLSLKCMIHILYRIKRSWEKARSREKESGQIKSEWCSVAEKRMWHWS